MADEAIVTDFSGRPVRWSFTAEDLAESTAAVWEEDLDDVLVLPDGRLVVDISPPDDQWYELDRRGLPRMDRPVDLADVNQPWTEDALRVRRGDST